MNANRTCRSPQQFTGSQDTDLAFHAFQIDPSWYHSYWDEEPRQPRASLLARGFASLWVFIGALITELRRLASKSVARTEPMPGLQGRGPRRVAPGKLRAQKLARAAGLPS